MSTRLLGLLLILYPFWAAAEQSKIVVTEEIYAELKAFAEKNGYDSPEAAYRAFKRHKAEQEEEDAEEADAGAANLQRLESGLQRVEARLAEEEEHLRILELQKAVETSLDTSLLILERINRAEGRIEQLSITKDALQKQISQLKG